MSSSFSSSSHSVLSSSSVGSERDQLARRLQLSPNQVKVWFQNRRIKHRKQYLTQDLSLRLLAGESRSRSGDSEVSQEDDLTAESSFDDIRSECNPQVNNYSTSSGLCER